MYKCNICNKVVPPKTRCHKLTINKRDKTYPYRPKANSSLGGRKQDRASDKGGAGWEIRKEINCCPECLGKMGQQ